MSDEKKKKKKACGCAIRYDEEDEGLFEKKMCREHTEDILRSEIDDTMIKISVLKEKISLKRKRISALEDALQKPARRAKVYVEYETIAKLEVFDAPPEGYEKNTAEIPQE